MNLLVWSDRLSLVAVVTIAMAAGYGVACAQRLIFAWHDRRRQQQQFASILQSAAALQKELWPGAASNDPTPSTHSRINCDDLADFEAALLAQIERLISYERRLQADLASARALLSHRSAELAASYNEARTDPVSALLNRRGFDEMLELFLTARRQAGRQFAILMIDVDHFKPINDSYGHVMGDRVLSWVGMRLTEVVRPTDCVARFGGDEFAILLRDVGAEQAETVGRRLLQEFRQKSFISDGEPTEIRVTLSIGVATADVNDSPVSLIQKADAALYLSKQRGRDQFHAYGDTTLSDSAARGKKSLAAVG